MTHVESELASQPGCWRRAVELVRAGDRDGHRDGVAAALPAPGERVAAVGCGTSWHMAHAYAARREAAGQGETDAFPASELPDRAYDRVVAISRSGTTSEVVEALGRVRGARTVALTAVAGSPVAVRADDTVVLDFAAERSVVQTRFATTALALLRASVGDDLDGAIADATAAVAADATAGIPPPLGPGPRRQVTFLGRGWTVGLAREAALKCCESAGAWAEAHSAMEYRHGPIGAAGPHTLVWCLDAPPRGLAGEIAATGAQLEVARLDPLAELVRVQRFAVASAQASGLDPDHPRNLRYSVILEA
jgi:fructoselysine-6-P-deglycase FrlB-like protein